MTKLRYIGAHDEVVVPDAAGAVVARGELHDFPADLAARLLEQPANWQPSTKPYKKPTDDDTKDEE